jgi:hypothetical protein
MKLPRWMVVADPRVEVACGAPTATAFVGDSVFLNVGQAVLDPDTAGYEVMVDGKKVNHPEWSQKDSELRFRYRAKTAGDHTLVVLVPQNKGEPIRHSCIVSVTNEHTPP